MAVCILVLFLVLSLSTLRRSFCSLSLLILLLPSPSLHGNLAPKATRIISFHVVYLSVKMGETIKKNHGHHGQASLFDTTLSWAQASKGQLSVHIPRRWTPWFICLNPHPQRDVKQKKDTLQSIVSNVAYPSIPLLSLTHSLSLETMDGAQSHPHVWWCLLCILCIFSLPSLLSSPFAREETLHPWPFISKSDLWILLPSPSFTFPSTLSPPLFHFFSACHFALIGHLTWRKREGRAPQMHPLFSISSHMQTSPPPPYNLFECTPHASIGGACIRTVVSISVQIHDHTIYTKLRLGGVRWETHRSLQTMSQFSILHHLKI